ncbi:MAG: hypothetical protein AB1Z98_27435 [Nannocystaceae bacterium]
MKLAVAKTVAFLLLVLGGACSEGASTSPFPSFPPGGAPPSSTTGPAATGTDGVPDDGDCCVANDSPGCNQVAVEACVCAEVTSCCSDRWSSTCAGLVDELGCGVCVGGPDTGDVDPDDSGGGSAQDCCVGGPEPGCNDAEVQACVCADIPFCCDTGWEKVCGSAVEALGCGHCGGEGDTGDPTTGGDPPPPPPPPTAGCCEASMVPGCSDAAVQDCVCLQDPYCCDTAWDATCVDQVGGFGCGDCGGAPPPPPPPGVSPCCAAQAGPGCGDVVVELCVCLIDSYCCDTQWDETCAVFADLFGCTSC